MSGRSNHERRLRLDLEYDGTGFAGWQQQPGQPTVQGALEAAARKVFDEPGTCVVGSGRTDSGAHAMGQVAHVTTRSALAIELVALALNACLPPTVRVRRASEVEPGFHARHSARSKEYRYQIWHGEVVPPFLRPYCYHVFQRLDVAAMAKAAELFTGRQDLSSFRAASCSARTPERTVYESLVGDHGPMAVYAIHARGFLQHMVRIIVGTLVKVGRGQLGRDGVRAIIAGRDRQLAPATAPAQGLFLCRVVYAGDPELVARAEPVLVSRL